MIVSGAGGAVGVNRYPGEAFTTICPRLLIAIVLKPPIEQSRGVPAALLRSIMDPLLYKNGLRLFQTAVAEQPTICPLLLIA